MRRIFLSVVMACAISMSLPAATSADQPFHFGFKKSVKGSMPSINEEGFKDIIDKNGAIFTGDTKQKEIYLTFDNGYENGYTASILDTLQSKQVPAIFFVTGHYIKDQPELIKRMVAEGHLIGNHSWSHPDMTTVSDEKIISELAQVKKGVADLTGVQEMAFVRPPRGIFNDRTLRVSAKEGYTSVFWSAAYKDWDTKDQKGGEYAYQKVMGQLHPGTVLLLHSVSKDNAEVLRAIIDNVRKQGYTFKSLNDLPHRNPNQAKDAKQIPTKVAPPIEP
ncbi:peptidoglycan-N-acetylmuramic acid deacetylase [Paenibacillus shirakamiensis]|uniref:Peptidoglycan-N-acetylmuramic acid deacetylase n=1 Tax=Paenibacillus shirakamiensis TaxID=1265935 RepID=A0ABS4JJM0_9BACL|nr:delta-lactam-biosynthetic de-N-acetylase [Paenibacillus shirakamiensis]MBP2001898.1 peptidoglycan-N-acetylmuramic acid deacetylase [Paenibacillus shirakamiensis]